MEVTINTVFELLGRKELDLAVLQSQLQAKDAQIKELEESLATLRAPVETKAAKKK